jgi:ribosomal protein S12 methylthiotransferase accessory factor YcaO
VSITATITITCHGYDLDGDCLKNPTATFVSTSANLDMAVENALYEAAQRGWKGIPSMARKDWHTAQYLCSDCASVTSYRASDSSFKR